MVEVASLRHLDVSTIGLKHRRVACCHFHVIAAQAQTLQIQGYMNAITGQYITDHGPGLLNYLGSGGVYPRQEFGAGL